jgi:tRNA nucleotidyltransferase (CCA-adding enzyme)
LVGGAVRNMLVGLDPHDFDIATDALPENIEKIFPKSININAKFGTIIVIVESKSGERFDVEVTTFRKEEEYYGGRWPAKVEFINDLYEDLSRRDYTINALAIDLNNINDEGVTSDEIVIDHFNGKQDLENKVIRAVGDPVERLSEDGLRSYRACRIASVYGFSIEEQTLNAIKQMLHISKMVSIERVRDEFIELITNSPKPSVGIELLRETGLLGLFLPELLLMRGIIQPKFHADDLYTHSLTALDIAEDSVKLAALFHDIGKINTMSEDDGGIHFYGHDVEGAKITEKILNRLKFPKVEVQRVSNLVRWHMFYYPSADWRKEYGNEVDLEAKDHGWTDSAVRRFVKKVGEDMLEDLFKLRIADANSNPISRLKR